MEVSAGVRPKVRKLFAKADKLMTYSILALLQETKEEESALFKIVLILFILKIYFLPMETQSN